MTAKNRVEALALERIYRLFELAEEAFPRHPKRSKRYVEIARKISTRNKATIPAELKQRFCRKCGAFLVEGRNARVERKEKWLEITCKECGAERKARQLS